MAEVTVFPVRPGPLAAQVDFASALVHLGTSCTAPSGGRKSIVAPQGAANANHLHRTESGRFP